MEATPPAGSPTEEAAAPQAAQSPALDPAPVQKVARTLTRVEVKKQRTKCISLIRIQMAKLRTLIGVQCFLWVSKPSAEDASANSTVIITEKVAPMRGSVSRALDSQSALSDAQIEMLARIPGDQTPPDQLPHNTLVQVLRALLRMAFGKAFQTAFASLMAAQPWFPLSVLKELETYNVGELLQIMRAACVQYTSLMPGLLKELRFLGLSISDLVSMRTLITAALSSGSAPETGAPAPLPEPDEQEPQSSLIVHVEGKPYLGPRANKQDVIDCLKAHEITRSKTGYATKRGVQVPLWTYYNLVQAKGGWTKVKSEVSDLKEIFEALSLPVSGKDWKRAPTETYDKYLLPLSVPALAQEAEEAVPDAAEPVEAFVAPIATVQTATTAGGQAPVMAAPTVARDAGSDALLDAIAAAFNISTQQLLSATQGLGLSNEALVIRAGSHGVEATITYLRHHVAQVSADLDAAAPVPAEKRPRVE